MNDIKQDLNTTISLNVGSLDISIHFKGDKVSTVETLDRHNPIWAFLFRTFPEQDILNLIEFNLNNNQNITCILISKRYYNISLREAKEHISNFTNKPKTR